MKLEPKSRQRDPPSSYIVRPQYDAYVPLRPPSWLLSINDLWQMFQIFLIFFFSIHEFLSSQIPLSLDMIHGNGVQGVPLIIMIKKDLEAGEQQTQLRTVISLDSVLSEKVTKEW